MDKEFDCVIIGGGAAGCFAAIEVARRCPDARVAVLERGSRPLAKVAITGGGRCNITNSFADVQSLERVYPRSPTFLCLPVGCNLMRQASVPSINFFAVIIQYLASSFQKS